MCLELDVKRRGLPVAWRWYALHTAAFGDSPATRGQRYRVIIAWHESSRAFSRYALDKGCVEVHRRATSREVVKKCTVGQQQSRLRKR